MRRVTAIVLAAGEGLRLKSKIPKPLVKINSTPIIIHCLDTFSKHAFIKDIIVVVHPKTLQSVLNQIKRFRIEKVRDVVLGGLRRQDSLGRGLKAIGRQTELVLIHDAARPFLNKQIISSVIQEAAKIGAAIVGVPVKATVKKVTKSQSHKVTRQYVEKTIDRRNLWEIQTPQVFKKDLILKAYKKFGNVDVTDDAMLIERLGAKVGVVMGSYRNIKITAPEDLLIAEAIAKKCYTA